MALVGEVGPGHPAPDAAWDGFYILATGTAGATGMIQGITSTFIYLQAVLLVGLELRAPRRGRPSILGRGAATTDDVTQRPGSVMTVDVEDR